MPREISHEMVDRIHNLKYRIVPNPWDFIRNSPESVSVETLVQNFERAQSDHIINDGNVDTFNIMAGDTLIALSGNLEWIQARLALADEIKNPTLFAHLVAYTGNVDALFAVVARYPIGLTDETLILGFRGFSIYLHFYLTEFAMLSQNIECQAKLFHKYPQLLRSNKWSADYIPMKGPEFIKMLAGIQAIKLQENIANVGSGWEKSLIELKKLKESNTIFAANAFDNAIALHIPRLTRLLNTEQRSSALKSLEILKAGGIESASAIVDNTYGQEALTEGLRLKQLWNPNPTFANSLVQRVQTSNMMTCFEKAAKLKIVNAYFQMAECYLAGIAVAPNAEAAFACYFEGAKSGDAQAQEALRNTTVLIGQIYHAMLTRNNDKLSAIAKSNATEFQKFANSHKNDLKIDRVWRVALLKLSMHDNKTYDPVLKKAILELIKIELSTDKEPKSLIQYLLGIRSHLTSPHFSELALDLLDAANLNEHSKLALCLVLSSNAQPTAITEAINAHLKFITLALQTTYKGVLTSIFSATIQNNNQDDDNVAESANAAESSTVHPPVDTLPPFENFALITPSASSSESSTSTSASAQSVSSSSSSSSLQAAPESVPPVIQVEAQAPGSFANAPTNSVLFAPASLVLPSVPSDLPENSKKENEEDKKEVALEMG